MSEENETEATADSALEDDVKAAEHSLRAGRAKDGVHGSPDDWLLISAAQGTHGDGSTWYKSTKALRVKSSCLVQVTTREVSPEGQIAVAEAVTFCPGVGVRQTDAGYELG